MSAKSQKRREEKGSADVVCGLFSKKEAAHLIAGGARHVHSSTLAGRDASARITTETVGSHVIGTYPWEQLEPKQIFQVSSSADRYDFIRGVLSRPGIANKRELKERLETVFEEILSNALYHAYQQPDGSARFHRRQSVLLPSHEAIEVRFAHSNEGVLLVITDRGGTLGFGHIAKSFSRCYAGGPSQIETKESGAGLGMYMIFEIATHVKVVTDPGKSTTVSCWIAAPTSYDPDIFSFNFFERR